MNAKEIVGLLLMTAGIILMIWVVWKLYHQHEFVESASRSVGTIIDYKYAISREIIDEGPGRGFGGDSTVAQAREIVRFKTKDGEEITFKSRVTIHQPLGSDIEVLYDPAQPHNARPNVFFGNYGWVLILGLFGVVFVFTGSLLRWVL
ncbi:Uncharacterised protein [BD1-7 clade bacterium]|uniref:DUF3592 domain-containing protein n=1 Tax=BD1-7 clade bacterium TaxID=2029982 RepID=A0A5S9P4A4_9GAMM|nr:Uncharacterised protein [BD1-7 clade bacterium]CAA0123005.1 Uncharacterised protein [BD1-7 clade bacterium]